MSVNIPEGHIILLCHHGFESWVTQLQADRKQHSVHLIPLSPALRVNGTAMDDWGVMVVLKPGTFLASFGDVAGYTKPADQVVTITVGATTNVTGDYT